MTSLRIVFMGSPDFAVPSLQALHQRHQVVAVVTQPDRPQGRGQMLAPTAVKAAAQKLGLEVLQPDNLRRQSVRDQLAALGADLFVVVAYGKILSAKMLAIPPGGCVNVHASLLPKYRGAAPIHWAIIKGEKRTGVTIMRLDEGMDTGPILLQEPISIAAGETGGSLHDRLAILGADALLKALDGLSDGTLKPTPQPETGASLAPLLSKDDGWANFRRSGEEVDCWIRGLDPWPGAFTTLGADRLKLFGSCLATGQGGNAGEVLATDNRGLLVACGQDAVWIRELQLAGRRRMPAKALLAGRPIPAGTVLGTS